MRFLLSDAALNSVHVRQRSPAPHLGFSRELERAHSFLVSNHSQLFSLGTKSRRREEHPLLATYWRHLYSSRVPVKIRIAPGVAQVFS